MAGPLRRFQRCAGVRFSIRKLLEAATHDSIFFSGAPPLAVMRSCPSQHECGETAYERLAPASRGHTTEKPFLILIKQ